MSNNSSKASWERLWSNRRRIFHYQNVLEIVSMTQLRLDRLKVLEVGCGRGATLLEFARRGALVTGVDYAESALAFCDELRTRASDEGNVKLARFIRADAEDLPFKAGSFDIVYSVGLLEHFRNPMKMIGEHSRVLRCEGYLILQVPQKYSGYTILKRLLIAANRWPYGGWETQYSSRELRALVQQSGLSPEFAFGYGSFSLAIIKHFLVPNLNHGIGGWHRDDGGVLSRMKVNVSLDVGILARKSAVTAIY